MGAEEGCMVYILALLCMMIGTYLFIEVRQNNKKEIILRINNRYSNMNEFIVAVKYELERQGKDVEYSGKGKFIIDGMNYRIVPQKKIMTDNENMQLTILKYSKSS